MKNKLSNLVHEMDNSMGNVGAVVESLSDVNTVLYQLKENMDIAVHKGEEHLYFREYHRTVRILADLMHYLTDDLVEAHEKSYDFHLSIFNEVRGGSHEKTEK